MKPMKTAASAEVRIDVWADCPDDMTMEAFEVLLEDLDNPIIRIDQENRRILMATSAPTEES